MELIEIRNNLVKLAYTDDNRPVLGQFIALTSEEKSYVAQYVNLKSDNVNSFAVAKLMFTFSQDGVVNEYDGSTPSMSSQIVNLATHELLDLLPVETPLRIGSISGQKDILDIDISVFEHNFVVFAEHDYEKSIFTSNCVRQLFRMKEKSVIIDTDSVYGEYPKIVIGKDFKLPLNSGMIDFIFEYDLKNVDAPTKAVIQDIFYAVQQYIKTLDNQFLPIDNFIDVVTAQYKETQMPELALLKNKLLKYKEADIFANDYSEVSALIDKLKERNCVVVNIKDVVPELQKEVINYIHSVLEGFDKYVYFFVNLTDDNSDKKLIKRLINHNHVFTTIFASHLYKYEKELKGHAGELMFFAPMTLQHDFAAYNTFLNKLNPQEAVIYGKLTQNIPFIVSIEDLELDLTKDDVFGDKQIFSPSFDESDLISEDSIFDSPVALTQEELPSEQFEQNTEGEIPDDNSIEDFGSAETEEEYEQTPDIETEDADYSQFDNIQTVNDETSETEEEETPQYEYDTSYEEVQTEQEEAIEADKVPVTDNTVETAEEQEENSESFDSGEELNEEVNEESDNVIEPIENIMQDYDEEEEPENIPAQNEEQIPEETANDEVLTEDDLDFIENNQDDMAGAQMDDFSDEAEEKPPVVPVFDAEDEISDAEIENIGFKQGDEVTHPRYGKGVVEKIIKYGNKTLCSISFENVGRRLLDPSISDFEKV